MRAQVIVLALLLVVAASPVPAQHHHEPVASDAPPVAGLGDIAFPNSGSAEAQPHFLRGLLLLHSFEFQPAVNAFREARRIDPDFAMAYWGEAMALNHPIWGEQDTAAARQVLGLLGDTAAIRRAKAPTEREQGYLAAVDRLYFGGADKVARDAAYSEVMGQLAARFPRDLDARALHALSILALSGTGRDTANYMRAAAVAEAVYEIDPRHPGALHYLIHAYDDPVHAPLGLRAARRYASVAPAASHAQHMPSHIFYALGLWDDAVASNIAALKTARDQGGEGYHALHWLQHAWLQLGRREDAAALMAVLEGDLQKNPSQSVRAHLAMARATWLVENRGADMAGMGGPVDSADIVSIGPFAALDFARGLAFVEHADPAAARASLEGLRARLDAGRRAVRTGGDVADRYVAVHPAEISTVEIMETMLVASLAFAEGRRDDAIRLAREAAAAEDAMEFEYGPPSTVKPPYELLGELLVRDGRTDEATAAFRHVLKRYPNRAITLEYLRRMP